MAQTLDHSHVQQLLTQGLIRAEAVATHPERNKIYNCLGAHVPPRIELSNKYPLQTGDTLLLCTDGLWGPLPPSLLTSAFTREPLSKTIPALIGQAEKNAGRDADNVTALAMAWSDEDEGDGDGGISTLTMPEDQFNSQIDMSAAPDADLSDDDIEKAISEIRNALAKSNKPPPA
jgi:serine/threonine protein phosphatase PrpC